MLRLDPRDFENGQRLHELDVRLLGQSLSERGTSADLAGLVAELSFSPEPPTTWMRPQLERTVGPFVEQACASGRSVALRNPLWSRERGGRSGRTLPKPQPSSPSSVPPDVATFVEIRLHDQDGRPVALEPYELTLADVGGQLEREGRAGLERLKAGVCDVRFPRLDGREWRKA